MQYMKILSYILLCNSEHNSVNFTLITALHNQKINTFLYRIV